MTEKVIDHPSRGTPPGAALLTRVSDAVIRHVSPRLEDLLGALDDDLFARAEAARTDRAQQAFFDAMRLLRLEREHLHARYLDALETTEAGGEAKGDTEGSAPAGGFQARIDALSLLADDDLEERLAVTTMSQRAERDCDLPLTLLRARVTHLRSRVPASLPSPPYEPRAVAGAWAAAIAPLQFDTDVRLVLYKRFEQAILLELGGLYEHLNKLLSGAGVLPELTPAQALGGRARAPARAPTRPRASADDDSAANEANEANEAGEPPRPAPGAPPRTSAQRQEPSPQAPLTPAGSDEFDAAHALAFEGFSREELAHGLAALPGLRRRRRYSPGDGDTSAVLQQLLLEIAATAQARVAPLLTATTLDVLPRRVDYADLLTRGAQRRGHAEARLAPEDEDVVNLVQALFDQLLADENLPVPMRALLARIQFPILRTALADSDFLACAGHPARRFLNLLTQTGIGWVRSDERAQDRLYQVLERAVDDLAKDGGDDPALVHALNQRIAAAIAAEEAVIERATARVLDKERARLDAEKTRKLVSGLVEHRCAQLPDGRLRTFLAVEWQQVMLRAHQRQGSRSTAWKQSFAVLRSLTSAGDLHGQALHEALADGLGSLGRDEAQASADAARVIDLLLDTADTADTADTEPPADAPASTARIEASIEQLPARSAIEAASKLTVGDWIEVSQEDHRMVRCRLATVTEPPERCIFLNRRGVRMATLSRLELAAAIEACRVRRLDSDQLFDNTLASVIGGLRDTATAASA
jgi:hypothetical protein